MRRYNIITIFCRRVLTYGEIFLEKRINKYLSECGYCSRRQADALVKEGRVYVGRDRAVMGQMVLPSDNVYVDGKKVELETEDIILAFYKPQGVVCTTASTENDKPVVNVVDYINYPKRVYPIGRLDSESEGLLLLTNMGEISNAILKSRNNHEKEYYVRTDRSIKDEALQRMRQGIYLRELDVTTKPCDIKRVSGDSFNIILTQGLNRQIRRMCESVGHRVTYLRRDRVVNITLEGLKKGRYRELGQEEIDALKKHLGMRL